MQLDAVLHVQLLGDSLDVCDIEKRQSHGRFARLPLDVGIRTQDSVGHCCGHQVWQLVLGLAPAQAGFCGLNDRLRGTAGTARDTPPDGHRRLEVVFADGHRIDRQSILSISAVHGLDRVDQVEPEPDATGLLPLLVRVVGQRVVLDRQSGLLVVDDAAEALAHSHPVLLKEDHASPDEHHHERDGEDGDADPVRGAIVFHDHFVHCATAEANHASHHLSCRCGQLPSR